MKIARVKTEQGAVYATPQPDGTFLLLEGNDLKDLQPTSKIVEGTILAPLSPPSIYCIGLNYRAHAVETGNRVNEFPVVFIKTPTTVQHPGGPIVLPNPTATETVDFEAELAVVIGQDCKNVSRENALDFVLGYTCANDVTARNWQTSRGGGQFCRAKTFDTFCPLGPFIVTADEIPNPGQLTISSRLNGTQMQKSTTADMIFDVPSLIEFLSLDTTLVAGTIILTGTPEGVGSVRDPAVYLQDGDVIEVEIENIGILANPVVSSVS